MAILATAAMAAEETSTRDRSKLSIFLQPSVSFIDFAEREYFQDAIDTLYNNFRQDAVTESESLSVAKQDFQKVNFCFPLTAGLQYQIFPDNFISTGISFIYDNESVVLTDRKNRTHNYHYAIQGIPLFLEYRLGIPRNLMTLSGESLFSIAIRWYWVLPGTEIYTTWGELEAKHPAIGSGFGISVGYLIANWKNFNIYGDIGFSSIKVESNKMYSSIVPDGPEEKAKWNIGGLTMQVRIGFGLWNEPEPPEELDDDEKVASDNHSAKEPLPGKGPAPQGPAVGAPPKPTEGAPEAPANETTVDSAVSAPADDKASGDEGAAEPVSTPESAESVNTSENDEPAKGDAAETPEE